MDKEPGKRGVKDITSNTKNAVLGTALAKPNEATGLRGKAKKLFTRYKEEMAWVQIARKDIEIEDSLARDTKKIIKANIYKAASLERILNLIKSKIQNADKYPQYPAKLIARAFERQPFKVAFLLNMDIVWVVQDNISQPHRDRQAQLIGKVLDEIYKDNHDKAINISVAAIDGFVRREMDGDIPGILKYWAGYNKDHVKLKTISPTGSIQNTFQFNRREIAPYIDILERAVLKEFEAELVGARDVEITFYQRIEDEQALEYLKHSCRVRVENKDAGMVYNERLELKGIGTKLGEGG